MVAHEAWVQCAKGYAVSIIKSLGLALLGAIFFAGTAFAAGSYILANRIEVHLNGVGEAVELNGSLYMGGLYLEHRSAADDVVASSLWSKRMDIRILEDKLYGRRFAQHFRERMAINYDRKVLASFGKEIQEFVGTFTQTFEKGDQVTLDFLPEIGVVIGINGKEVKRIPAKASFYEALISTWVGPRPPTAQFKSDVLGKASADKAIEMQQRFNALSPSKARVEETNRWAVK